MRSTNSLFLAMALMPAASSLAEDHPAIFKDGILTIPSVNTDEQVGKYQDAVFKLTELGSWELLDYKEIGKNDFPKHLETIYPARIEKVEPIVIYTFPLQVLLQVSGGNSGCESTGKIVQRMEGTRFDVVVNSVYPASPEILCTLDFRPYVKTVPLPVYGLSAGTYSYDVNGVTGVFTLPVDNRLPGDCEGSLSCQ